MKLYCETWHIGACLWEGEQSVGDRYLTCFGPHINDSDLQKRYPIRNDIAAAAAPVPVPAWVSVTVPVGKPILPEQSAARRHGRNSMGWRGSGAASTVLGRTTVSESRVSKTFKRFPLSGVSQIGAHGSPPSSLGYASYTAQSDEERNSLYSSREKQTQARMMWLEDKVLNLEQSLAAARTEAETYRRELERISKSASSVTQRFSTSGKSR
jgi:hypothetical protein